MSNYVPEVQPPQNKSREKTNEESPSLLSLPDAVAMSCVARLSRLDLAALSLVSKSHRSLVTSPELWRTRLLMGCTKVSFYICLRFFTDLTPRWFILNCNNRLSPIPSYPNQAQESSSFVVVEWGIYVIGGLINGNPTSDVLFLDCLSHTWRRITSMKMARASASATFVDGKIYVCGGCKEDNLLGEVFDLKTQTWDILRIPEMITQNINQSVEIEDRRRSLWLLFLQRGWCVIGKLKFLADDQGRILWHESDGLDLKVVKGLENLVRLIVNYTFDPKLRYRRLKPCRVKFGISSNSDGNIIVIFWNSKVRDPESLELCFAEISLERRQGGEIWGKVKCSDDNFKLDPLSFSSRNKVLYSAIVRV